MMCIMEDRIVDINDGARKNEPCLRTRSDDYV